MVGRRASSRRAYAGGEILELGGLNQRASEMVRPVCDGSHRFNFENSAAAVVVAAGVTGIAVGLGSGLGAVSAARVALMERRSASAAGAPTVTPRKIVPSRTAIFFLSILNLPYGSCCSRAWCGSMDGRRRLPSSPALLARRSRFHKASWDSVVQRAKDSAPQGSTRGTIVRAPFRRDYYAKDQIRAVQARTRPATSVDGVG